MFRLKKRYYITILFCCILIQLTCYGQKNTIIDSLNVRLKTETNIISKAELLNKISIIYKLRNEYKEVIRYSNEARLLLEVSLPNDNSNDKLDEFNSILATTYINLGDAYLNRGDYDIALINYNKSLKIHQSINGNKFIGRDYNNIGYTYEKKGNYSEALKILTHAIQINEYVKDKEGLAISYNDLGLVYWSQSDFTNALKYFFKALNLFDVIGRKDKMAKCYNNIGIINVNQGNYHDALRYYFLSLKTAKKLNNKADLGYLYNNIGMVYVELEKIPSAIQFFEKSLKICEEIGDKEGIATSYLNIGTVMQNDGELGEAQGNLFKALEIYESIGDKAGAIYAHMALGDVAIIKKDRSQAFIHFDQALEIAKQTGSKEEEKSIYQKLTQIYAQLKNYQKAYECQKYYMSINDSLYNGEKSSLIAEMSAKYETEKKDKEIGLLNKDNALKDIKLKQKNRSVLFLIIGIIMILLLLGLIYNRYTIKLKNNIIIEEKNEALKKANETAKQSLQIQEQFLANTSHEIRTPMNGILGMTRQLLETPLNPEQAEYLNAIQESSNNLLHVVNDILDISKIRAGKVVFERKEFGLVDLFKSVKFILQYKAEEKKLLLENFIDPKLPTALIGDSARLIQILLNLVSNAIKFTETGKIYLSAKMIESDESRVYVQFCVTDSGIGIPEDKLDYIFEAFAQAEVHTTRKYGGTGLGLTISKFLVEKQGGHITVESEVGKGSSFYIDLTFERGKAGIKTDVLKLENLIPGSIDLSKLNVLLVEDNVINQRVALFELNKWNVNTDVAENAASAFEKLKKDKYDIILMDISMPGMDGIEATRFIRKEFHEPAKSTPIIAMTASALLGEKERCFAAGMNDYISKPFNPLTFYKKVVQWSGLSISNTKEAAESKFTFQTGDSKLIDLTMIRERASGNMDYIKEMIQMFIDLMPEYLIELKDFHNDKNWIELNKQAHKMKTPVAYFGVQELGNLLVNLELHCASNHMDEEFIERSMQKINTLSFLAIDELKIELSKIA